MANYEARWLILNSYLAVAKRALSRTPPVSYGRETFYAEFWNDAAHEVGADIAPLSGNYFRISKARRSTVVQFHYVNTDTYFNKMLVDQKPAICKILRNFGYPIPQYIEYDPYRLDDARQFLADIKGRAVVKPCHGSGGGGVTTGVHNGTRLRKASIVAAANSSQRMMIEEESVGDSYRLLFLDGELIDAIQRRRPSVTGDGKRSIRGLIDDENRLRTASGPGKWRAMTGLQADLDCEFYLQDNGRTLDTVPPTGQRVLVKNASNENSIDDNFNVREDVHVDYREMGRRISSLLGLKLIGIDIMSPDISVSFSRNGGMVNEINIPPGLHYHELMSNPEKRASVGARILQYVLSDAGILMSLPVENP